MMNNQNRSILLPLAIVVSLTGIGSMAIVDLQIDRSLAAPTVHADDGMEHSSSMTHTHNMDVGPADANYELRFIDSMIPHHQGGVVMAKEVLQKSKRPELIKLAKNIITEQKQEIAQMQKWRQQWYPKAAATPMMWHSEMNHQMPMTAEHKQSMMMSMSLGKADALFDRRFLDAMIPHHQGAVTMSQDSLQKSQRPELQKLARNIVKSQQSEIDRMTQLRQKWYGNK